VGAVAPSTAIAHRLRVIDATNIQEPGSTGTDLRLHHSIRLPDMAWWTHGAGSNGNSLTMRHEF
jgi:hypothetical protein